MAIEKKEQNGGGLDKKPNREKKATSNPIGSVKICLYLARKKGRNHERLLEAKG